MVCPKCGFENQQNTNACLRCGVIFAKVRTIEEQTTGQTSTASVARSGSESTFWGELIFGNSEKIDSMVVLGRVAVLAVVAIWGSKLIFSSIASNAAGESLLHLINLPFHEFGHLLFRPLGRFMTSLGGTLGQFLFPLICFAVILLKTRDPFGAAICLWWTGENFLDIAPYINDARAGVLPLLGGNSGHSSPYGFHDWEYLLTETNLLRYDHFLAKISHGFGSLLMLVAVLWGSYLIFQQYKKRA